MSKRANKRMNERNEQANACKRDKLSGCNNVAQFNCKHINDITSIERSMKIDINCETFLKIYFNQAHKHNTTHNHCLFFFHLNFLLCFLSFLNFIANESKFHESSWIATILRHTNTHSLHSQCVREIQREKKRLTWIRTTLFLCSLCVLRRLNIFMAAHCQAEMMDLWNRADERTIPKTEWKEKKKKNGLKMRKLDLTLSVAYTNISDDERRASQRVS